MANFKGDINNDLKDAFSALLVNNKGNNSSKEEPINSLAPSFFTLVNTLLTNPTNFNSTPSMSITPFAVDIINSLSNQSLLH